MMQVHQEIKKFEEKKVKVMAICPENQKQIERYLTKQPLAFDVVADSTHEVAKTFGQQVKLLKLGRTPAQIVLDSEEKKVFEHYAKNMADIVENETILKQLP